MRLQFASSCIVRRRRRIFSYIIYWDIERIGHLEKCFPICITFGVFCETIFDLLDNEDEFFQTLNKSRQHFSESFSK